MAMNLAAKRKPTIGQLHKSCQLYQGVNMWLYSFSMTEDAWTHSLLLVALQRIEEKA